MPSLVFGAQVKGLGVLQVWRKYDSLVSCLARELDAEVPRIESDKGKVQIFADQVFLGKCVEAIDSITECASIPNMLPGEGGYARAEWSDWGIDWLYEDAFAVYLFAIGRVEQDPAELYDFGRVFCDIDTVLVAGGRNVDDHVPLQTGALIGGHCSWRAS